MTAAGNTVAVVAHSRSLGMYTHPPVAERWAVVAADSRGTEDNTDNSRSTRWAGSMDNSHSSNNRKKVGNNNSNKNRGRNRNSRRGN